MHLQGGHEKRKLSSVPDLDEATTMRPRRSFMSCSELDSARIAMISLATVMSNEAYTCTYPYMHMCT